MREILFRGKTTLDNEWVIGAGVYKSEGHTWIIADDVTKTENRGTGSDAINPETVGQYTGLTDKNGKKIFEGDIVLFPWGEKKEVFSVEFVEGEFEAIPKRKSTDIWCIRIGSYAPEFEVIGNIHDNPELLRTLQNDEVRE